MSVSIPDNAGARLAQTEAPRTGHHPLDPGPFALEEVLVVDPVPVDVAQGIHLPLAGGLLDFLLHSMGYSTSFSTVVQHGSNGPSAAEVGVSGLEFVTDPTQEQALSVELGLDEHNAAFVPARHATKVRAVLVESGRVVAGLDGAAYWRKVHVRILWVHAESLVWQST